MKSQVSIANSAVIVLIALSQGLLTLSDLAISYMFKDELGFSPSQLSFYGSLFMFPWIIKPLWGFISDSCPIMSKRRTPYLLFFGLIQILCWMYLGTSSHSLLTVAIPLVLMNISVCFCNVIGEALLVEESQKSNHDQEKASNFVTLFFGTRSAGMLLTSYSSGYLLEETSMNTVFLVTAVFPVLTVAAGFLLVEQNSQENIKVSDQLNLITSFVKKREIYIPVLFIFLFCAVPVCSDAFFFYFTNALGFSPEFMGRMKLAYGVASVVGMLFYNYFLKDISFKTMLVSTTFICVLLNLSQLLLVTGLSEKIGIPNEVFAIGCSFIVQVTAEMNLMPLLVLCCKICPKNIEGSLYALLMSTWNLGSLVSGQTGGLLMLILGITETEFSNMWLLIITTSVLMVFPLPILYWVEDKTEKGKSSYEEV